MFKRFIRALTAFFNAYSFYRNPIGSLLSMLLVLLIPYLIYIFWGSIVVLLLAATGVYAILRFIYKKATRRRRTFYRR